MNNLKILIVGAGIAGLSLRRLLAPKHRVSMIEKTHSLQTSGTGILLGVNAMQILNRMGLDESVKHHGRPLQQLRVCNHHDKTLNKIRPGKKTHQLDLVTHAIHRSQLHQLLVGDTEHAIKYATTATRLGVGANGVDVQLSDKSTDTFDLVIGADGIFSTTRTQLNSAAGLRYSGYTCWRCLIPGDARHDEPVEMWGPGKRMGLIPLGSNQSYVFLVKNAKAGTEHLGSFDPQRMTSIFNGFAGNAPTVLERLHKASNLVHNDLYDLPKPVFGNERIILVGDAAHAATPNLGQGAGMAIEDAWLLSQMINEANTLGDAFTQFVTRRQKRVQKIIDLSFQFGKLAQWESQIATSLRNIALRTIPDKINTHQMEKLLLDY